jgi:hypothetical protein
LFFIVGMGFLGLKWLELTLKVFFTFDSLAIIVKVKDISNAVIRMSSTCKCWIFFKDLNNCLIHDRKSFLKLVFYPFCLLCNFAKHFVLCQGILRLPIENCFYRWLRKFLRSIRILCDRNFCFLSMLSFLFCRIID